MIFLSGCQSNINNSSQETEVIEDDNGFIDFYHKFHTDSLFQMAHISFPLEGTPSVSDTVYDGTGTYYHQKEDWLMHRPIDMSTGEFKNEFDMGEVLVTERIINNQNFMLVRRFYFNGKDWSLIYYGDLNPIK